jgi:transcriptional regulator with XRE-family HTH domain
MVIGERLKAIREERDLSQGDIEKRTGLLRCYVSRVENGHTVPSVETLEKFARAFAVPMYQLFYYGEEPPKLMSLAKQKLANDVSFGVRRKDAKVMDRFRRLLGKTSDADRKILLFLAQKMAQAK